MLSRWLGGSAALVVTLLACALVIGDLADAGMRHWWAGHALTTDTVAGLLVLAITVLVVDQVVSLRQFNDRARAVGAQAAIILVQARRASREVSQAVNQQLGEGERDAAADEFRTYMMMLLVGAPVLIDAKVSRAFLERAQELGGEMARALQATAKAPGPQAFPAARLQDAVDRLRAASTPLLQVLDPETLRAVRGDEPALPASRAGQADRVRVRMLSSAPGAGTAPAYQSRAPRLGSRRSALASSSPRASSSAWPSTRGEQRHGPPPPGPRG